MLLTSVKSQRTGYWQLRTLSVRDQERMERAMSLGAVPDDGEMYIAGFGMWCPGRQLRRVCGGLLTSSRMSVLGGCPAVFFDDVASRPAAGGSGSWCPVEREGSPPRLRPGDHAVEPVTPGEAGKGGLTPSG